MKTPLTSSFFRAPDDYGQAGRSQSEAVCDARTVLVWSIAASPDISQLVWEYNGKEGLALPADAQARAKEPSARLMRFTHLPVEKAFSSTDRITRPS